MVIIINHNFLFLPRFDLSSTFWSRFLLTLGSAFSTSKLKLFSSSSEAELAYYSRVVSYFLLSAYSSYLIFPVLASYSSSSMLSKSSSMSTLR